MMIGLSLIALVAGGTAAAAVLLTGGPVLYAVLAYMVTGMLTMIGMAAFVFLRRQARAAETPAHDLRHGQTAGAGREPVAGGTTMR